VTFGILVHRCASWIVASIGAPIAVLEPGS
jgi:hypothetical protein